MRCGRCDKVFDALDNLIDLDPPEAVSSSRVPAPAAPASSPDPRVARPPATADPAPIDIQGLLARKDPDSAGPLTGRDLTAEFADELGTQDEEAQPAGQTEPPTTTPASGAAATPVSGLGAPAGKFPHSKTGYGAAPEAAITPAAPVAPPGVVPAFMQVTERPSRWNSPAMRVALIGTSLILLLMLMMQVVYHQRDSIAARSPIASALLQRACERWNCSIEPPRRIADLSIESSALSKISGQPQSVRLTMSLRNKGAQALAMPAVELSLTDSQGKLIARKALLARDFKLDPPQVEAAAALPLQLVLSTGEARIAGYTVELFYP